MVGISPNVNESDSTKSVGSRLKQTKSIGRLLPPTNPALEWVTHPTSKTDETLPIALSTLARDLLRVNVSPLMLTNEQQRFTIVAQGCTGAMTILIIIGVVCIPISVTLASIYFPQYLVVFILLPILHILGAIYIGIVFGRRTQITVDSSDTTMVMTVSDGWIRRLCTCFGENDIQGTHTYRFQDVLQVKTLNLYGSTRIVIYFVNGYVFKSLSSFDRDDAMRFVQTINAFLIQNGPQNIFGAPLVVGNGSTEEMMMAGNVPPMYAMPHVYGGQPGYTSGQGGVVQQGAYQNAQPQGYVQLQSVPHTITSSGAMEPSKE